MLNEQNKELCKKVLEKYGYPHQIFKMGEECTELAQAIFRIAQGDTSNKNLQNMIEEFVDVYVMQQEIIFYLAEQNGFENIKNIFNQSAFFKLTRALKEDNNAVD